MVVIGDVLMVVVVGDVAAVVVGDVVVYVVGDAVAAVISYVVMVVVVTGKLFFSGVSFFSTWCLNKQRCPLQPRCWKIKSKKAFGKIFGVVKWLRSNLRESRLCNFVLRY